MKTILIALFFTSTFLCFSQSVYKQWEKGYGPKDMVLVENDDYVIAYFTNGTAGTLTKIGSSTGIIEAERSVKPNPKWYSHTNTLLKTNDDNIIIYMTGDTNNTGFYLEYYDTGKLDLIEQKHFLYDTNIADSLFEKRLINFIRSIIDTKNEKLYTVIKNDFSIDTSVVVVYDIKTGKEINRIPYEFGNNEKVNIALSPDESQIVTYSTGLEYIKVWDLNTMELVTSFPPKSRQTSLNNFTTPVDVKFSTIDPDIIYILGMRGYQSNQRRGIFKYSISENDIIKEISQGLEIDTQKLMFFDNEKRILRFNERILNIFNLDADSSEYFKPWGSTLPLEMNVLYSEWHDLFIVSGNYNMFGIRYFRPELSGVNLVPKSQYSLFPNPATASININLHKNKLANSYKILNTEGKLFFGEFIIPTKSISINIDNLPNDVYVIEIKTTAGDVIIDKFVKK